MRRAAKRGPGPSHLLITPDHAGNVVGIDPHKQTLTATVLDPRGGIVASEHFKVCGDGHRALEVWAKQFGMVARWGVEGASGWGRHTAMFLIGRDDDVRDVCANRTPRGDRARQRGKSDTLDSERIAREVLAHPLLPKAFKRAGQDQGPEERHELLAIWQYRRLSILKSRQHLVNEAEQLLCELPLGLLEQLPAGKAVRPRLAILAARNRRRHYDPATTLRLAILDLLPHADRLARSRGAPGRRASRRARARQRLDPHRALRALRALGRRTAGRGRRHLPASPRAGSRGSTRPRRCLHRPLRDPANQSATATTPAATAASTLSCTAWPSRNCAASHAPRRSTTTRAPTSTPRRRPAASSNATSPTLSTDA